MAKRSKTSSQWLQEHESDPYVKAARAAGLRSRAAFKLEEIHRADRILRPGMTVIDLGAAPGGWSQIAARILQGKGRILASDILEMEPIAGVEMHVGDFTDEAVLEELMTRLGADRPQLVMSDMAPNTTGIAEVDHSRSMYLAELALDFAHKTLQPGGDFLVKVFQGREFQALTQRLRNSFASVKARKPKASRSRSVELYLLARDFRM